MTEDPLKKINQELYNPKSSIDERKFDSGPFDIDNFPNRSSFIFKGKSRWEKMTKGWDYWQKMAFIIGLVLVNAMIIGSVFWIAIVKFKQTAFSEKKVMLEWMGDKNVQGADLAEFELKYFNKNRTRLKNVELKIVYPRNFIPEKNFRFKYQGKTSSLLYIGDLKPYQKGKIKIKGRFYAPESYEGYLTAFLSYYPKNFSSKFIAQKQHVIKIKKSPLELHILSPKEVLNNGQIEYEIHCKNDSQITFKDIYIKAEYPNNFSFQNADPYPIQKENIWYLASLVPGNESIIKIKGTLKGVTDEIKTITVSVGKINEGKTGFLAYSMSQKTVRITSSPLFVKQLINNQENLNVHLGDVVRYKIKYGNNSKVGLRNVVINLKMNTKIVDWSKLRLQKGAVDANTKTITWKAVDIPKLANLSSGEQGEIDFDLPIKNKLEINSHQDKNFVLEGVATIDSPDLHIETYQLPKTITVSNRLIAKLTSKVILEEKGYYNDSEIENFGPIPPEVNKETTYVLHWKITNVSNEIKDVTVKAFLPTGNKWKGIVKPENEHSNIHFNERTHEIVWKIPYLENGKGILDFPKEVSFQIGVVPQINQVGKEILLLNKVILEAEDTFTHEIIHQELKEKRTNLMEDASIPQSAYKVINES